eukprot:6000708-Alexandrium_andersonii.AAC.1
MSASLVGSEMCIRDSPKTRIEQKVTTSQDRPNHLVEKPWHNTRCPSSACLLYTSDAADDM